MIVLERQCLASIRVEIGPEGRHFEIFCSIPGGLAFPSHIAGYHDHPLEIPCSALHNKGCRPVRASAIWPPVGGCQRSSLVLHPCTASHLPDLFPVLLIVKGSWFTRHHLDNLLHHRLGILHAVV